MTAPPQPTADPQLSTAERLALLLVAYQQSTQALREQLAGFITTLWRSLGFYGNAQQAEFVGRVVPVVLGAQQHMAALTSAHIAQQTSIAAGVPFEPFGLDPARASGAAVRNGTSPDDVYARPFNLVWRQLADLPKQPGSIEQATQAGEDRAVQTGLTDLQLAKTHAAAQTMAADPHIIGWRRALEGSYSCGLCIVASTQLYSKGRSERPKLMPIHPGCDCAVQPVYRGEDVAKALNEHLLGDVHAAIADRFGKSASDARALRGTDDGKGAPLLYKDLIVSHDHGELGPVLGVRGRPFAGPGDLG